VLKGQVTRANGGLYYEHPDEFVETLSYLVENSGTAKKLGRQGLQYVDQNYRWPVVMKKVEDFLQQTVAGS
jgi:glycosyltransferase involved in cell wall biosynthesis